MHSSINRPVVLMIVALAAALGAAGCRSNQPKPGTVLDEAMRAKRTAATIPGRRRRLLSRHGRRAAPHEGADPGAQHVDRLDRRQRSALGRAVQGEPRLARLPEDAVLASDAALFARYPLELSGPGQRALLQEGRPDPTRIATGSGSTFATRAARPTRSPTRTSTKASQVGARGKTVPVGSYYGEPTGIVGLRLFPNPDFDEKARKKWDSERYYRDPTLLRAARIW